MCPICLFFQSVIENVAMKIKMSQTCAWRRRTELAASSEAWAMNFHFRVTWYFISFLLCNGIHMSEEVMTTVMFAKRPVLPRGGKKY